MINEKFIRSISQQTPRKLLCSQAKPPEINALPGQCLRRNLQYLKPRIQL